MQTLLLTIASRLGLDATVDVMEAWVNLFAFILRSMLPVAIKGIVVETELNINSATDFDNEKIAKQTEAIEEERQLKKKLRGKDSSSAGSSQQYNNNTERSNVTFSTRDDMVVGGNYGYILDSSIKDAYATNSLNKVNGLSYPTPTIKEHGHEFGHIDEIKM